MFKLIKRKLEEKRARDKMLKSYDKYVTKLFLIARDDPDGYVEKAEKLNKFLEENIPELLSDGVLLDYLNTVTEYTYLRFKNKLGFGIKELF